MKKTKIMKPVGLPKKLVAKLLATENIDVVSEKIPTAYFDLKSRKIGIPIWENVSQDVYDLMVGHEVGHALYTPIEVLEKARERKIPKSFVNVIEDIRIEKMIQNKYPGLITNFRKGYKELVKGDFFGIAKKSKPLLELGLVDRLNIYAKTKDENIIFLDDEKWIFDDLEKMTTWLDVLNLAEKLAKYMEDNLESQGESVKMSDDLMDSEESEESGDSGDSEDSEDSDSEDSDSEDSDSEDSDSEDSDSEDSGKTDDDDWETDYTSESITDKNLQKKLKQSADTTGTYLNVKMPDYDLKDIIVNYKELSEFDDSNSSNNSRYNTSRSPLTIEKVNSIIDADFKTFKNSSIKTVNLFVKEFEMKKSADNYSRATVSKSGSLNLKVLHKYKFEDDLFKKVTNIPDGKSHGFIFYLDWSASMDDNLIPTMKQLLNLVWFAKKTNIPFEVYAFSDQYCTDDKPRLNRERGNNAFSSEIGDMRFTDRQFKLLELCNSKMNNSKLNEALKRFYTLCKRVCWFTLDSESEQYAYSMMEVPSALRLGGTPLLQTAYVNVEMTKRFIKTYGVDKLNVCYLTDGLGGHMTHYVKGYDDNDLIISENIPTRYDYPSYDYEVPEEERKGRYYGSNTHVKVGKHNHFDIPPARDENTWKLKGVSVEPTRGKSSYGDLFSYQFEQLSKIAKQNTNCNILGFHLISTLKSGKVKPQEVAYVVRHHHTLLAKQLKKDKHFNDGLASDKWRNNNSSGGNKEDYISKTINKEGVFNIPNALGMDDYFLIPGGKGIELDDTELSPDLVGANKKQLTKAFGKNRNDKVKKRVLCGKFMDTIC